MKFIPRDNGIVCFGMKLSKWSVSFTKIINSNQTIQNKCHRNIVAHFRIYMSLINTYIYMKHLKCQLGIKKN